MTPCGCGLEYLNRITASSKRRLKIKHLDRRVTCASKLQTRLLVREGAPQPEGGKCPRVIKIMSRHQDGPSVTKLFKFELQLQVR
jgi:hypothetical protein